MVFKRWLAKSLASAAGLYLLLATVDPVGADAIWLVGQKQPIYGIVESSDQKQIQFRRTTDGQQFESQTIGRNSVETIVVNHDSSRLSSLPYGDWKPWLELAEELDSQKQDPVARNLAIRLLVIVTANSNDAQQRGAAMDGLVSLARNNAERQQFNRLRYLETGKGEPAPSVRAGRSSPRDRKSAADLVRRVRLQQTTNRELNDRVSEKKLISSLQGVCSWQESDKKSGVTNRQSDWHVLARQIGTSDLQLPSIKNVTEFDPSATKFVTGKWTKP